jgi:hypothetical protein
MLLYLTPGFQIKQGIQNYTNFGLLLKLFALLLDLVLSLPPLLLQLYLSLLLELSGQAVRLHLMHGAILRRRQMTVWRCREMVRRLMSVWRSRES